MYSRVVINGNVNNFGIRTFGLSNNVYFTVNDMFCGLATLFDAKNVGPEWNFFSVELKLKLI